MPPYDDLAQTIRDAAPAHFTDDPERSWSLPGPWYTEPAVFAAEQELIFARTWQYVGHISALAAPGDKLMRMVAQRNVVVARGEDGCLSGRCTIDSGSCSVRIDTLCGFVFATLDERVPELARCYPGLEDEIRSFSPVPESLHNTYGRDYPVAANWKVSVENFSECYHCPNGHRSLCDGALDIASYRITTHPTYHSHRSRDRGDRQGYRVDAGGGGRANEFGGWMIWPNLCLEVFPGGNLNIFHHRPVSPERTIQTVEWYFPHPTLAAQEREVVDFMHVVRMEDVPLCESVQRGLHSRGYRQGRFIVDRDRTEISEHAVHDFQLKVSRALAVATAGQPEPT
jgi:phenylpropionate dioxygenase-like ring-hydroxylating dioxygenase large terminal subunit